MKTLTNSDPETAAASVPDLMIIGNPNVWKLVSKAASQKQGWMKSTKAMDIPGAGCLVQVTTQQQNPAGDYEIAEALTFVPGVSVQEDDHGAVRLVEYASTSEQGPEVRPYTVSVGEITDPHPTPVLTPSKNPTEI